MRKRNNDSLPFDTIQLESGLLVPDILDKIIRGVYSNQSESHYHIPKGLKLHDEYGRAFQIACAQWQNFAGLLTRSDIDTLETTTSFVKELLTDSLGYALTNDQHITINDRIYHIPFLAYGSIPVFIAPFNHGLDDISDIFTIEGSGSKKRSVFRLAQEFLNASIDCTWGMATNGLKIRLLRDAATLTRPSFLEFDLETILSQKRYPDFAGLWRTLHSSRAVTPDRKDTSCTWEQWRSEGQNQGTRVREGLRHGVTKALEALGQGFLSHPSNSELQQLLHEGSLSTNDFFQELLRLVYRCLFLFTLEERTDEQTDIPLLHPLDTSAEAQDARDIYAEGYSLKRFRHRVLRRSGDDRYDDLWQGITIVFHALYKGEPRLALPSLGGLFSPDQCPHLDRASLANKPLLEAMFSLRWAAIDGNLSPVDYRHMGTEELGSVYESLLELVPTIDLHTKNFGFIGITEEGDSSGHTRKTTGSYYTPDNLVQELIKSALDPVIDQRLAANPENPTEALLDITVIDPACGSGHFLLAAARRLAEHLAELRTVDGSPRPEDYRHALREVIASCIYGVDKNPMALELARTALWLEGFEPGRPLSFLNHHLVCGDALLGLMDFKQLRDGIPKEAYKKLSGDDAQLCRELGADNRASLKVWKSRQRQGYLHREKELQDTWQSFMTLEKMPGKSVEEVEEKERAYQDFLKTAYASPLHHAADCFIGAFLAPKDPENVLPPTTRDLLALLLAEPIDDAHFHRVKAARQWCSDIQVLHWPLIFPQITAKGGFDCVLANPPWERIKLQEEEFFATRSPDVAAARNKAERAQRIKWLGQGMLAAHLFPEKGEDDEVCEAEKRIYKEFMTTRRTAEAISLFAHLKKESGGRYPLTGVGDVNTYALFAESICQLLTPDGRAGFIVPTGIATDDSTKRYFSSITQSGRLASLYDFENRDAIFPGVHRSYKFCLLTLGASEEAQFSFFLTHPDQLSDDRRTFALQPEDFSRINPNTGTCPIFRSRMDAEITRKIYRRVPVLLREAKKADKEKSKPYEPEENPWGISFLRMLDMSNDSHLFANIKEQAHLPLYEAKMIHQFDHRWASYHTDENGTATTIDVSLTEKQNPAYSANPRYWVSRREVFLRIANLPKGLLQALKENHQEGIVVMVNYLLFGQWLLQQGMTTIDEIMLSLYPSWQKFVRLYPFAAKLAPTQLGLCSEKAAGTIVAGPHCLPALPTAEVEGEQQGRGKVVWYPAEKTRVKNFLESVGSFPSILDIAPSLSDAEAVCAFAEELLEYTSPNWLMGWRDICRATDERTVIASVVPRTGVGNNFPLMLFDKDTSPELCAVLLSNLSAIVLDFIGRHKVGGTHLNYFIYKQLPIISPEQYTEADLHFIVPRVLELTYTSHDLKDWAKDLGYTGPPFSFKSDRRAKLKAELDAYYAKLYGLTRDELCFILNPTNIKEENYPSETFRVLKNNEINNHGEYRTQRLVLEAWDAIEPQND